MIYVKPEELHKIWPDLKRSLIEVKRKSQGNWLPEDVYTALKNGTSTLHVADDGILVVTPQRNFDGIDLFVWIAHGEGNVFEKYLPEVEQMGRLIGAKRIRFESSRKGWEKRFTYVTSIYEKEIR